jgi:RimJ/RimL family protein N-acetyltransferase
MGAIAIPHLHSARLRLRPHTPADFPSLAAMWAEAEVVRYISGKPSSEHESWMRMLVLAGLWPTLGFGYWAVEERATGAYVGQVGFADFRRETEPAVHGVPEAGWVLAPAFHGKGYATEAVLAAHVWVDANVACARTVCMIDPNNTASQAVAAKCGYREFARSPFKGATVAGGTAVLFERPRPPGARGPDAG